MKIVILMICKHLLFLSLLRYGCIHIQNIDDSIFAVKILQNDASCEDNLICENTLHRLIFGVACCDLWAPGLLLLLINIY